MKLIWKLLRENISKIQLGGFFIANLIGLSIVLIACQFYFDINPVFTQEDTLFKKDYFTVTKKIGLLDVINTKASGFTGEEIDELKAKRFVKDLGAFTPSQFNVFAGISQGGMNLNTEMFFESVPTQFIDVKSEEWRFSPVDESVPIILPKNYLDLYNFGFAEARSMPKITEGMVGLVSLNITIYGNGQRKQLTGRIVGFSNRINTILVPESFMTWANQNFGNDKPSRPSRLIAEIDNIADPQIAQFFKGKGYEIEGDNVAASRMALLLKTLVIIVVAVGSVICILAFFILVLSIYLLLEKNMEKLKKLRLIGYSKAIVTRPYELLVIVINLLVFLLSVIVVAIIKSKYTIPLKDVLPDFQPVGMLNTGLIGLGIFLLLTIINIIIIRRKVK